MLKRAGHTTGHAAVMPLAPRTPLLLMTLLTLAATSGCDFAVDTPLGVEEVPIAVAPGEEVSDEDFREQLESLSEELETLNAQARELEETIARNVAEILEA